MTYDLDDRIMWVPQDKHARERAQRLRELGVGDGPDPELDEFSRRLAEQLGAPFAMVNLISDRRQYLAGIYSPNRNAALDSDATPDEDLSRALQPGIGFCPHVIARGKALVLEDVGDYPRFAGDPVVDDMGIHSYVGAPLIDRGIALGTVCAGDGSAHTWGRSGLDIVKSMAVTVMARINERAAGAARR